MLESHELTHVQFVLLASLWWLVDHDDHSLTQAQLAQQAGTDPMMTSQVTRKLENPGSAGASAGSDRQQGAPTAPDCRWSSTDYAST